MHKEKRVKLLGSTDVSQTRNDNNPLEYSQNVTYSAMWAQEYKSTENELTLFQCSYCEPTKVCESGSLVKKTLHKSCEGQEWMTEQCLGT